MIFPGIRVLRVSGPPKGNPGINAYAHARTRARMCKGPARTRTIREPGAGRLRWPLCLPGDIERPLALDRRSLGRPEAAGSPANGLPGEAQAKFPNGTSIKYPNGIRSAHERTKRR
jgi:hypothetical protein